MKMKISSHHVIYFFLVVDLCTTCNNFESLSITVSIIHGHLEETKATNSPLEALFWNMDIAQVYRPSGFPQHCRRENGYFPSPVSGHKDRDN